MPDNSGEEQGINIRPGLVNIPGTNRQANIPFLAGVGSIVAAGAIALGGGDNQNAEAQTPPLGADTGQSDQNLSLQEKQALIKGGAHPQKYEQNGVTIEVLGNSGHAEARGAPNAQAEFQVYRQFGRERMEEWMSLSKLSGKDKVEFLNQIAAMRKVIETNPSFEGMKSVTKNHAQDIIAAANKYKIPPEVLLSISLIENGGGENMVSPSGAKGYMQLAPDKFPDNGPGDAGKAAAYLVAMRDRFGGDLGIAVWGYHAGEGNVYHALQVYFNDTRGTKFGDIIKMSEAAAAKMVSTYKQLISDYKVNLFTLFSNKEVQKQVLVNLEDETELYTWKAIAANMIINEQLPGVISKVLATDQKPIVQFPR